MSEIVLDTKLVGDVQGKFYIPSYQRGYRWGEVEVERLLEDIYANGRNNYCLQPVVVRKDGERYELIDGQQRLTSLYILLQYIRKEFKPRISVKYELEYETRAKSADFLKDIDESLYDSNIDFYYMYQAYKTIDDWFSAQEDSVFAADEMYGYLVRFVKIIWYEVGEEEDAIALFARLNIGKIPLTSAELIKALFLSRDTNVGTGRGEQQEKQQEMALQWDNIERELHNESLWAFLTNDSAKDYQTRIDIVLDLMTGEKAGKHDKYSTFFHFYDRSKNEKPSDVWKDVRHTFLILKDWYENHEFYHKIGYLVTSESQSLADIYMVSKNKRKREFIAELDEMIRESISISKNYAELSYENSGELAKISKLLLLFNVEFVRRLDEKTQRFPFDRYKSGPVWSLEHIHAQQSEGMSDQKEWKKWLELHIKSIKNLRGREGDYEKLLDRMQACLNRPKLRGEDFEKIRAEAVKILSADGSEESIHSIFNLALLNTEDNAALSNSVFAVKRDEIIEMDKRGQYIPYGTKMVFLKYFTPSADNQLHFWGHNDRVSYVEAINDKLREYLPEPIYVEKGSER